MGGQPSRGKTLPSPSSSPSVQEPGPVPMQAERSRATAVALGSFPVGEHTELSLRPGDPLTIISEWLYEGLSREKAEELLLLPGNSGGAFLIRESQTRKGCYSLSVRLSRPASWDRIRHYRIQCLDNGWLYISPRLTFPSLQALVDHYSELADDICCLLKEPCALRRAGPLPGKSLPLPVTVQRAPLNWKELDSSLLFSEAPALGESPLLSEGLREAISSYISLSDDSSLDDAMAQSRGQKGIQRCST
ncbi:src-like-adapter 2 isoform X2 [Leptonychotes weddellii]|uniref:Src-like-adapter 2 isoform X2 n=1 Tax=Leptonychotes weddellii TaxID=9713 RepID=A0A7F8RM09_LEPWE|nr:src-like-adapter 2 isoform X2 [Leptonychotes weddellii]